MRRIIIQKTFWNWGIPSPASIKFCSVGIPIIAKETGSGFSRDDALELRDAGVKGMDVGGLGGTYFAAIAYYRAEKIQNREKMHTGK